MQIEKLRPLLLAALALLSGCDDADRTTLPACKDYVAPEGTAVALALAEERPKVVTLTTLRSFGFLEVDVLRRQIRDNPEFDYLFYLVSATPDSRETVERFVRDNRLPIIVFFDWDNEFRKANGMSDQLSMVSCITDRELKTLGVAVIGSRMSPFDTEMRKARARLGFR